MENLDIEKEKKEILKRYKTLLKSLKNRMEKGDKQMIRKAFDLALEQHKDMRRKSGEPYIYHPLEVAQIVVDEIQLGPTAVVCALLHDTVEDTDITLEDIKSLFGEKIMSIIDGLTKISGVILDQTSGSLQAENFRKMLLTLSNDVRVILIKLADRLHNMRTLDSMKRDKQLKIASETLFLYAPLAHRLGLYSIKTELEDLCLKYKEPEAYFSIAEKLQANEKERMSYINKFSLPIMNALNEKGFVYNIKSRSKSIYSIWQKMKKQNIPFEEVYDIFAIRLIIDVPIEQEKTACWAVYSIVTDFYRSNMDRLRDWINTPKSNGYESLHTTVMGPGGKWVEVQIRSTRMDEVAEMGYAAHWKYKDKEKAAANESALEEWLRKIRELLENPETNALDFMDDFKLNLFSEEIFVFTPKGIMKTLPVGASALDFAYEIHSEVGNKCIGAKINNKLLPMSYKLKSGEQVEILVSDKQKPKEDWFEFVTTAKAKTKIKEFLKDERKDLAKTGKVIFDKKLKSLKVLATEANVHKICHFFKVPTSLDLYYQIAINNIELKNLKDIVSVDPSLGTTSIVLPKTENARSFDEVVKEVRGKNDLLILDEKLQKLDYQISECCNPIKGDDVFGFLTDDKKILIHRTNCPNAIQLMSNFAYRIVKAKWTNSEKISFLAGIKITGTDDVGIVNNITNVISSEYNVNMRSISFETNDGIFEGTIMVFVQDTNHLTELIKKLKKVLGVVKVFRI
ncbi:MAG: RelA/SpoT family protein [Bacteroidota bacterium]|jgi:guanosine-3',5'-bis(diphosphate) 3'-pyrophosphohydrolase